MFTDTEALAAAEGEIVGFHEAEMGFVGWFCFGGVAEPTFC